MSQPRYLIEGIDGQGRYRRVREEMPGPIWPSPEWKRVVSIKLITGMLPRKSVWRHKFLGLPLHRLKRYRRYRYRR